MSTVGWSIALTWLGRILRSADVTQNGTTTTATYSYNADLQRTKKVVGSTTTSYYYNGDILAGMTIGSTKVIFMYDENGDAFGFTYAGTAYYYVKNLQGDVIAITDATGTVVVECAYDAWGKLLEVSGSKASTIGQANPLRYRSYVYDAETGYYYLNSRYYDPELCRFISADEPKYLAVNETVSSYNLFSYCLNAPVKFSDNTGESATIAGAICGGIFGALNAWVSGGSPEEILQCAVVGMVAGAAAGFVADVSLVTFGVGTVAIGIAAGFGGAFSAINSAFSQYTLTGEVSLGKLMYDASIGALMAGLSAGTSDAFKPVVHGVKEGIVHTAKVVMQESAELTIGHVSKQLAFDIGASGVTGFGGFLLGLVCDGYRAMLK